MRNLILALALVGPTLLFIGLTAGKADAKENSLSYDAKFLDQFSEHHSDAIKMGEIASVKAANPEVKKMAEEMVSDQKNEISKMKAWRDQISSAPKMPDSMPKMEMSPLEQKTGKDFDLVFLDMMAKHHQQGVAMAKEASGKVKNHEVKSFARKAAEKQSEEREKLINLKKSEAKKVE